MKKQKVEPTAIEYGIIASLIAVVIVSILVFIGPKIPQWFG